jgi:hypothetical protein
VPATRIAGTTTIAAVTATVMAADIPGNLELLPDSPFKRREQHCKRDRPNKGR